MDRREGRRERGGISKMKRNFGRFIKIFPGTAMFFISLFLEKGEAQVNITVSLVLWRWQNLLFTLTAHIDCNIGGKETFRRTN